MSAWPQKKKIEGMIVNQLKNMEKLSKEVMEIIEDLRLEVVASVCSRDYDYIDNLFQKSMDKIIVKLKEKSDYGKARRMR